MRKPTLVAGLVIAATAPLAAQSADLARWEAMARNVTIIRDDWGIPHVYGRTDADAVFGVVYAQAEDDFNRVETNYLTALGRLAEAEGEQGIWQDLRMRLFMDHDSLRALYRSSPDWLKQLMDAFADGLNFYLHTHPEVRPRVIRRFEPWMALACTEGSIGWDIERVSTGQLAGFYGGRTTPARPSGEGFDPFAEPSGSNGIAIGPSRSASGRPLLLINPHTSFYYRAEVQMVSEEGLNAYGAVTWGQFFVYQGFNDRVGWMHTSSGVDNIDEFLETVRQRGGRWYYRYGGEELPVEVDTVTLRYSSGRRLAARSFPVYRTRNGPVVRRAGDQWVSVRLMQDPVDALTQSYSRTRARSYGEFLRTMRLHTNSSNNTIYADADGNIAYFHANYIPRRDTTFDWSAPVDGSNPATSWGEPLPVEQSPHLLNPVSGWLYNANDAPWWASGASSPRRESYPAYVDNGIESARGRHAVRVLEHARDVNINSLVSAAFDSYLPWFERAVPALVRAWESAPAGDSLRTRLAEQVALLRGWDLRWSAESDATSLAVFWGTNLLRRAGQARAERIPTENLVSTRMEPRALLEALGAASDTLAAVFGSWRTPWGEINRFQRLTGDIVQSFTDSGPSIPVGFTSGTWGSLASFSARPYPGTRRWYGTSGNSFVAVVEFGDSVRARAVTAGGLSGDPSSPHFNDQAARYAEGNLRDVYFYRSQLAGHIEREYHPGRPSTGR